MIALTGQVQTQVMGPGAFQDIDLASAFEAVARFSQTVLHGSNHAELASLAAKTRSSSATWRISSCPTRCRPSMPALPGRAARTAGCRETAIAPPKASLDLALYRIARAAGR